MKERKELELSLVYLSGKRFRLLFNGSNVFLISFQSFCYCSTYFTATKYTWLIENVPEIKAAKEAGTMMIGTVDSWLLYVSSDFLTYYSYTSINATLISTLTSSRNSNLTSTDFLSIRITREPQMEDFI